MANVESYIDVYVCETCGDIAHRVVTAGGQRIVACPQSPKRDSSGQRWFLVADPARFRRVPLPFIPVEAAHLGGDK
jgi:hypothetical protein